MVIKGVQTSYVKESYPLLWAGQGASRGKITTRGESNCMNYSGISIACTKLTNVAAIRTMKTGGWRIGDQCTKFVII
jgi:hypothetical protein